MYGQTDGPTIGILLEQALGHVSHGLNLEKALSDSDRAVLRWRELPFAPALTLDRLPPRSNWTVRSGMAARVAVRELQREGPLDALLVHTHVPAVLLGSTMERIPTVVSVDATPCQIETFASSYRGKFPLGPPGFTKQRVHTACFRRAASLVAWSKWAADSLVADYGVDRDRIEVIPPGVIASQWHRPRPRTGPSGTVKILFVGADFEREGGENLLEAVRRLNEDPEISTAGITVELHVVTAAEFESAEGVHVHRGLSPNSSGLIGLFHECDVFALPTNAGCAPLVLSEAAAAGLPTVATDVGAISETVVDGVTGHLIDPHLDSLTGALARLVVDADHRRRLGANAAEHAARTMDAKTNAGRILDRLVEHARPEQAVGRVLLTVSGEVRSDVDEMTAAGKRPLADYKAIAAATEATILDRPRVAREGSSLTALVDKVAGSNLAMAMHIFRQRRDLDVVITDGEQVGLPLAAMLRVGGRSGMRHVMIGHRLSPRKKTLLTKLLGLSRGVDEVLVYSTHQLHVAQELFNRPGQRVRLIDFMVDTEFFRSDAPLPVGNGEEWPKVCSAGREYRDYPTLIEAVRDLRVEVVIASASPWSRRSDNAREVELPPNVTVTSLSQLELRAQIEESCAVIVPLLPIDFQAGVTTILEGMAMSRPVICTATVGQVDVVVDGVGGRYVPPGDVAALRGAIQELLSNPDEASAMGDRGRELVEERADVRSYAATFAQLTRWHLGAVRSAVPRLGRAS